MKCFIANCKNEADPKGVICTLHTIMWANSPQGRSIMESNIDYSKAWQDFIDSLEEGATKEEDETLEDR
jgi:hypothetical protein